MSKGTLSVVALAAMFALPLASSAQTSAPDETNRIPATKDGAAPNTPAASTQYGQGGSPHCDKLSGADREQCLRDEGAKTEGNAPSGSAASGGTSEDRLQANLDRDDRPSTK